MAQVSAKLRSIQGGFAHWCPACEEMHEIRTEGDRRPCWSFDGNVDAPTFGPSVKITGKQCVIVDGEWTGEWIRGADGEPLDYCCHYILTAGVLNYCGDCTHALSGQSVPLPDLPGGLDDS